jgi:hypothetical protein
MKYLQPEELRKDVAYMADAVAATEVWVQVSVIAKAFMEPTKANVRSSLLYVLCGVMADNPFWRKANQIISPVFANALLKMAEGYALEADFPNKTELTEELALASKYAVLDVFGVILYALGGYSMATSGAVEAKKEMAKLLFD